MAMTETLTYRYARPSSVSAAGIEIAPSTLERSDSYFRGFVERPDVASAALLSVARVARTRYFILALELARLLDPVLTSEPAGLHFESFSGCGGVHARFDLLRGALDPEAQTPGTVNVDFNEPMRAALARIRSHEPLHLRVGFDEVELTTMDGAAVERRVPLPERWARGFAEVGVAAARLPLAHELKAREAQRLIRTLPRGKAGLSNMWLKHVGTTTRFSPQSGGGAVWLSSPERLRNLEPVSRHVRTLSIYATPDTFGSSVWVADLGDSRLSLTLSPERVRGFSGEGGLLFDLADPDAERAAAALGDALQGRARFGDQDLASTGLDADRTRTALTWLGARGNLGFDPTTREWFRRTLPFGASTLVTDPPRLRNARALVDAGRVDLDSDSSARVASTTATYNVRLSPPRCTCTWWRKHPGDRGPCKHILAATIARTG